MISRVFTDVPPGALQMMANTIADDNGTFTQEPQDDGNFTLYAEFPGDPPPDQPSAQGDSAFPWMPIAEREIGVEEGRSDPRIREYFASTSLGPQPSSVAWCSAFVNFCVKSGGLTGTNSALARSWLNWGQNSESLVPGCIVVLSRGSPALGHVGFYVGDEGQDSIRLLGGNQSNSVKISSYPRANILGRRKMSSAPQTVAPPPAAAEPGGGFNLESIPPLRRAMARQIIDAFAAAGFNKVQQAAALANAIAESDLEARQRTTTSREDSIGLFQLNMRGGRGEGHSAEELMDPEANIAIVIKDVKAIRAFCDATSLRAAVDAFVRFFEIPADIPGQTAKRLDIAERLMA
jgi:uncharacterized protein (TIGR02594 family)